MQKIFTVTVTKSHPVLYGEDPTTTVYFRRYNTRAAALADRDNRLAEYSGDAYAVTLDEMEDERNHPSCGRRDYDSQEGRPASEGEGERSGE